MVDFGDKMEKGKELFRTPSDVYKRALLKQIPLIFTVGILFSLSVYIILYSLKHYFSLKGNNIWRPKQRTHCASTNYGGMIYVRVI